MEFLETSIFTKQVVELLSEIEYADLQIFLMQYPDVGSVIPHAKGLRKLRWKAKGKGKRSGIRIIYYWYFSKSQIFLLLAYRKNQVSDLTKKQIDQLACFVKEGVI